MKKDKEIYHNSNWLCSFGFISGFSIENECNTKIYSHSSLGWNGIYELPEGI